MYNTSPSVLGKLLFLEYSIFMLLISILGGTGQAHVSHSPGSAKFLEFLSHTHTRVRKSSTYITLPLQTGDVRVLPMGMAVGRAAHQKKVSVKQCKVRHLGAKSLSLTDSQEVSPNISTAPASAFTPYHQSFLSFCPCSSW